MPERAAGQRRETLGELDHRAVGEPSEDDVFEFVKLRVQSGVDARIGVAEQVDPPRADAVEVAAAVEVVQPGALTTGYGNQRQGTRVAAGVLLHLGARVPDGAQAARKEFGIIH